MPVGVPDPVWGLTVAVKVTVWPGVLGFGVEVSAVVLARVTTFCVIDVVCVLKLPSPPYGEIARRREGGAETR